MPYNLYLIIVSVNSRKSLLQIALHITLTLLVTVHKCKFLVASVLCISYLRSCIEINSGNLVMFLSTAIRVYRKMGDVAMVQSLESIEVNPLLC